jgi:aldose 1-epimerase|uniref:aldose epimerase family protein n=1 Tax=Prosthecobacter sp. TaxID=1965333 RepID=UPI0037832E87
MKHLILTLLTVGLLSAQAEVTKDNFGTTRDGESVERYTLKNKHGLVAKVITLGGIINELHVPDRAGKTADIALGFDTLAEYEEHNGGVFFGCITGRVANRIAGGKFDLEGKSYTLDLHPKTSFHLHGGLKGFSKVIWKAEIITDPRGPALRLTYLSKDGDQGFPGNLNTSVIYVLTEEDAFVIEYEATTDKATPINLTNHTYFNLAGAGSGTVLDHRLTLQSKHYLETDADLLPTGKLLPVTGTAFDFTKSEVIGSRLDQISIGGYDHAFVLAEKPQTKPSLAAEVYEPKNGRVMRILTDQPGIQLYTATYTTPLKGKNGAGYDRFHGLCLETQHHPDSVHHAEFPTTILRPGETYRTTTIHQFTTR